MRIVIAPSFLINRLSLSVVALVLGLMIAGCGSDHGGGDNDHATIESSSLSKKEFIKKADAICQARVSEAHEEFEAFVKRKKVATASPSEQVVLANEVVDTVIRPPLERQIAEIRHIGAPVGDEDQVAAILIAMQKALDEGQTNPTGVIGGNGFARSSALARRYGLAVCGSV